MQVAGQHQDGAAIAQLAQVGANTRAHQRGQVAAAHVGIQNRLPAGCFGQLAQVEQIFIGKASAGQHGQAAACFAQLLLRQIQRLVPTCRNQFAAFAHQRLGQALFALGEVVAQAALVAHPDFVDAFILPRHGALDHHIAAGLSLAAHVVGDVAAHRAMRAQ